MTDFCNEIEKFGKGIGSASRYRLVENLFKGEKTVSELVKITGLSQPAVSQHLKTLKSANIVFNEKRGQEIFYSINIKYILGILKNLSEKVQKQKFHNNKSRRR
ncbi:transcriptional regulator [Candidatus Pacearchaeota archaeon CG10_big_fil_rev_8_21_14_0_10_30_48]|nr:MAG: transcriptional regulator [Candidatus Pacearchaeota archaeon CG10_big_fil_rev_8_21_14_0_10_30_48]